MTKVVIQNNSKSLSKLAGHLVQTRLSARITGHEDKETQFLLLKLNQIRQTNHEQISTIECDQCWEQCGRKSVQRSFTMEVTLALRQKRPGGIFQVGKWREGISGQVA